jgi:hypothetical protein
MTWSETGENIAVLDARPKTARPTVERPAATPRLKTLQGRIQRVNYRAFELTAVADGTVYHFVLNAGCEMWFNDAPAILRCFHPLDPITIVFDEEDHVKAIHSWDPVPAAAH